MTYDKFLVPVKERRCFEDIFTKDYPLAQFIRDTAVFRTAPATPGLSTRRGQRNQLTALWSSAGQSADYVGRGNIVGNIHSLYNYTPS